MSDQDRQIVECLRSGKCMAMQVAGWPPATYVLEQSNGQWRWTLRRRECVLAYGYWQDTRDEAVADQAGFALTARTATVQFEKGSNG